MYQFSTQTIINSSKDSNGTTDKYAGTATALSVTRVGTFKKDKIVSIYKRPYSAGVKEVAQVTIPTVTAGKVVRVEAVVRLEQSTNSEYANSFLWFQKPVVVEVIASGTASTDATALKNQLNALKDRFGFSYITATTSSADLILTATDNNQRFYSIKVLKEVASYSSITTPEYEDVTASTFSVTTAGKLGFGDDEYMIKSIQLPTYENTRHFGISTEERPVLGGNYTQYTLRYVGDKDGQDGIVSGAKFAVTHVFYVKSDLVTGFEAAITATGLTVDTIGITVTNVSIATASVTTAATANGVQLVATTTPAGATNIVYALRSAGNIDASGSGADFTKVSITNGGILKFASGHGIVATDTIGLTVTVDGFTKETTVVMTA